MSSFGSIEKNDNKIRTSYVSFKQYSVGQRDMSRRFIYREMVFTSRVAAWSNLKRVELLGHHLGSVVFLCMAEPKAQLQRPDFDS